MRQEKTDIITFLLMTCFFLLVTVEAVAGWTTGAIAQGVITTLLAVATGTILVADLRRGIRAATPFEWFRVWMTLRPLLITLVGFVLVVLIEMLLLAIIGDPPAPLGVVLVFVPVIIWIGLIYYTISRAPRRREPDSAYKRRIGYK